MTKITRMCLFSQYTLHIRCNLHICSAGHLFCRTSNMITTVWYDKSSDWQGHNQVSTIRDSVQHVSSFAILTRNFVLKTSQSKTYQGSTHSLWYAISLRNRRRSKSRTRRWTKLKVIYWTTKQLIERTLESIKKGTRVHKQKGVIGRWMEH